jgi:hypothetical protein
MTHTVPFSLIGQPSTNVVVHSIEEAQAIKADRRKQMNKFGVRRTTVLAPLTRGLLL